MEDLDFPMLIPLMDYLRTIVGMLMFWSFITVYMAVFVPKRRQLMKRYLKIDDDGNTGTSTSTAGDTSKTDSGNANGLGVKSIIGNVWYDRPRGCFWKMMDKFYYTDLAYVTYKHPEGDQSDQEALYVEKKIRTYHPYHRENVEVLVLDGNPLSGQPRTDVERDVASFKNHNGLHNKAPYQVLAICIFWILFCMSSAIYILSQMKEVENLDFAQNMNGDDDAAYYNGDNNVDSAATYESAMQFFLLYTCVFIPIIAIGGNIVQWMFHFKWVALNGRVVQNKDELTKVVPNILEADEIADEDKGKYLQMV